MLTIIDALVSFFAVTCDCLWTMRSCYRASVPWRPMTQRADVLSLRTLPHSRDLDSDVGTVLVGAFLFVISCFRNRPYAFTPSFHNIPTLGSSTVPLALVPGRGGQGDKQPCEGSRRFSGLGSFISSKIRGCSSSANSSLCRREGCGGSPFAGSSIDSS
jgi:hypothetical protein